ncbi:Hsp20/alpha crystallin family protein [Termitidicoccus mucosus]|uniref:Heat-shock protein Hsp20 n=1 Tax=Termitidicoccus mucosus TaxID=1184151 RepID=A0A178IFJ6_9BACT|nr:heat-shock protein Hsp20 [Opitutaceae bacterium TSB47]
MRLIHYTQPDIRSLAFAGRSPWAGLESEVDRWFESVLGSGGDIRDDGHFPLDLYEDEGNTYVRANLPGIARSDINVEIVDGYLNISATRKTEGEDGGETFSISRSLSLPDSVEEDKVTATSENGVLTVTLPKKEEAKPRKVAISVN